MKNPIPIASFLALNVGLVWTVKVGAEEERVQYEPTWESLDRHQTPEWLMDAKFGFFIYPPHPTQDEWDEYWKREDARAGREVEPRTYHYAFGSWETGPWDPDGLAQLAVDSGARYVVFCIDAVSFFLTCPSKYADLPDSPWTRMGGTDGPRDYVGEIAEAVRDRGLHFGIYRNLHRTGDKKYWLESMCEIIERYQPSTLWLDEEKFKYPTELLKGRELLAHYYNHSKNQGEVACEDALGNYKVPTIGKRLVHGDWYRREAGHSPAAVDISDGYYVRYEDLEKRPDRSPIHPPGSQPENLVHWLIHCASHGGNLEAAFWCTPESSMPAKRAVLLAIGVWLQHNGEAIYGTRPWYAGRPQDRTPAGTEIRYTTRGNIVYAIFLGRPETSCLLPRLRAEADTTIRLLGRGETKPAVPWRQKDTGVELDLAGLQDVLAAEEGAAEKAPQDFAYTLSISPRPQCDPN
jgi:alpha-L-fucosidase